MSKYRTGLPPVEQVCDHEAKGGYWQWHDLPLQAACVYKLGVTFGVVGGYLNGRSVRQAPRKGFYRPCLPDGTPCPWPDESQGEVVRSADGLAAAAAGVAG